jgi:hypothetical protein
MRAVLPDFARQALARNDLKAQLEEKASLARQGENQGNLQFGCLGQQSHNQLASDTDPLHFRSDHQGADLGQVGPENNQRPTADDLSPLLGDHPLAQRLIHVPDGAR